MAEAVLKIPKVKISPSTLQYQKHKLRVKPFYKPGFTLTKEQWGKTLLQPWFKKTDPLMPPYPYGKNAHFPEANYGLYGGTTIMSGNKISDGRNKGKTLRKWFPNIRFETIRSEALDMDLHIPIRARVMRTIRKCGGLDEYLLGDKPARIKELGLLGWKLRWLVMRSAKMQGRFAEERAKYGLPKRDPVMETFEDVWKDNKRREHFIKIQDRADSKLRRNVKTRVQHLKKQFDRPDKSKPYKENLDNFLKGASYPRRPSKFGLPDMVQELDITDKRQLKAEAT